ncbi:MAG: DUF4276 family protein [Saprospiraceae bacterium]|nr:DUF4276 family protein [Saprospiraceae bacterium]
MRKVAIFVEGQTELIFVREFLLKIFEYQNINIGCFNLFTNNNYHSTDYAFPSEINETYPFYFEIINVGNDNAVLSRILRREKYLWNSGFDKIIGLRDMYSRVYREEAQNAQISETLNQLFKQTHQEQIDKQAERPNDIHFIFAIMEVEAWFLGFQEVFMSLDARLTIDFIQQNLDFDLSSIDLETTFFHPTKNINEIYSLVNETYTKRRSEVEAFMSFLSKDDFELLKMENKCQSYSEFYNTIPKNEDLN